MSTKPFPGSEASVRDILALALAYHRAALALAKAGNRTEARSSAPFRLAAIHAVELYLNALIRHAGVSPEAIRDLGHDLERRAEMAAASGMVLRTRAHLAAMTAGRDYLICRYGADFSDLPPMNRMTATLNEVAAKTVSAMSASTRGQAA